MNKKKVTLYLSVKVYEELRKRAFDERFSLSSFVESSLKATFMEMDEDKKLLKGIK